MEKADRLRELRQASYLRSRGLPLPVPAEETETDEVDTTPAKKKKKTPVGSKKVTRRARDPELEEFFSNVASQMTPDDCRCWECHKPFSPGSIRAATAHILPKKLFRSVRAHPDNYLILPASCCHDRSHTIATFKKMGIWREAVERFLKFEHLLTKKEKSTKYYSLFVAAAKESFPQLFNN